MRLTAALLFCLLLSFNLPGQASDPIPTTLCELAREPTAFDGKLVRVRGTIIGGFEVSALSDKTCGSDATIWLDGADRPPPFNATEYAGLDSIADAQQPDHLTWLPMPKRQPVALKQDAEFKKFEGYVMNKFGGGDSAGCPMYSVTVTITGRFDHSDRRMKAFRDKDGKVFRFGPSTFGHLQKWESRLVMESVSDTVATKIDPSVCKSTQ